MSYSSGFQWKQKFGVWIPRCWKAFNRWRKKYWLTRTLILLALFSPILYESVANPRLILKLVRIACDAIISSSEPQLAHNTAKYYQRREIKTIQILMLAKIDENRNGILDDNELPTAVELEVNPDIIQARVVDVKLDEIITAARKMDLGISIPSAVRIRKEAWFAAAGETKEIFDIQRRKINAYFDESYSSINYGKWETWKSGFVNFFDSLQYNLANLSAVISMWIPWFLLVFIFSLSIQGFFEPDTSKAKISFALIPASVFILISHKKTSFSVDQILFSIAFLSMSFIVGKVAVWMNKKYRFDFPISLSLLIITAVLTVVLPLFGFNPVFNFDKNDFFGMASYFFTCSLNKTTLINSFIILLFIALGFALAYGLSRMRTMRSENT